MTDPHLTHTLSHLLTHTHTHSIISHTLQDIITAVEHHTHHTNNHTIQTELNTLQHKYTSEVVRVQQLQEINKNLLAKRQLIRQKANQTKEHFIVDISQILRESRNLYSLRNQLKEMDQKLLLTTRLETELLEAKKRVKELEKKQQRSNNLLTDTTASGNGSGNVSVSASGSVSNGGSGNTAASGNTNAKKVIQAKKIPHNLLVNVDDAFLMGAFSFLSTKDVIYTAQASRYLYKKVDAMFSIGSGLCKPEWAVLPAHYTSQGMNSGGGSGSSSGSANVSSSSNSITSGSSSVSGSGSGIVGLTKAMAEELSKKLSAPELKTILSMMDNQKKLSAQLHASQEECAKAKGKLEVSYVLCVMWSDASVHCSSISGSLFMVYSCVWVCCVLL
jgi:hypothetical protein